MKTIGNLSYRTDCIFHENNGSIEEKEAYYVIRTPSNPDFWFGNLLLFKAPPCEGCISVWIHAHHVEFADTLTHVTFGWDSEDPGAVSEFTKNGFKLESSAVLEMREYRAIRRTNPAKSVYRAAGFVECAKAFGMSRSKHEPESEAGADADQTAVSPVD